MRETKVAFKSLKAFVELKNTELELYKKPELDALKRKFKENNLADLIIIHFKEKNGDYYFQALDEKQNKKLVAEGISKDEFHAKDKLVQKLSKVLKAMSCQVKNPLHKRKEKYSTIY